MGGQRKGDASRGGARNLLHVSPPPPAPRPLLQAWGQAQEDKLIRECASKELEKIFPDLSHGMIGLGRIMTTSMPFAYVAHLRSGGGGGGD